MRSERFGKISWVLKNLCFVHSAFTFYFIYDLLARNRSKRQFCTNRNQTERDRFEKLAINSRDTLYCWKVNRLARIGSMRLLGCLINICFVHCVSTIHYLLFISPKWQRATVLHESKPQLERDRLVKLAINIRDTLYCWKVKWFARICSVRLLGCLKLK